MDKKEKEIIKILDTAICDSETKIKIDTIAKRVEMILENNSELIMAWEPIPLNIYKTELPDEIKSSWVFVLRKKIISGAERHPNSIQRMMSYKGSGDFQTKPEAVWNSNFLQSNVESEIEQRWISIPAGVWHQGIVGDENWVVVSFQTAKVSELIEERPEEGDENKIHRQKYADKKLG